MVRVANRFIYPRLSVNIGFKQSGKGQGYLLCALQDQEYK